jgi:hypothetical protein
MTTTTLLLPCGCADANDHELACPVPMRIALLGKQRLPHHERCNSVPLSVLSTPLCDWTDPDVVPDSVVLDLPSNRARQGLWQRQGHELVPVDVAVYRAKVKSCGKFACGRCEHCAARDTYEQRRVELFRGAQRSIAAAVKATEAAEEALAACLVPGDGSDLDLGIQADEDCKAHLVTGGRELRAAERVLAFHILKVQADAQ